jgi:hypothetical protein
VTIFDDPNREAVGLDPIWTDAENPPLPEGDFDPTDHTVAEVEEYLAANPDDRERVLNAEAEGKARVSLLGDEYE